MSASSRDLSDNRPYQGYPYVNPAVFDVPTVDAATAAKWANLPRKPIISPATKNAHRSPKNNSHFNQSATESSGGRATSAQKKEDIPAVYIDLPDETEDISRNNQVSRGQENRGFVEETIFFDPFENRQIDVNVPREQIEIDTPGPACSTPGFTVSRPSTGVSEPNANIRPNRPAPPSTLNLQAAGSSSGPSLTSPSRIPGFMNKESQVYGSSGSTEDGFNLPPLPVSDYPAHPPTYDEAIGINDTNTSPRTVVVVPESSPTVGIASSNRKLVQCQNCRLSVHTVVVRENGPFTHFIALLTVIMCLLPLTVMIYCTDFFKYQMHFCPNCNHKVGYEIPILCQDMVYHGQ